MDWLLNNYPILTWAVGSVFTIGFAWGAAQMKEKGIQNRLQRIEEDFSSADAGLGARIGVLSAEFSEHKSEMIDRLARIETKLDTLITNGKPSN